MTSVDDSDAAGALDETQAADFLSVKVRTLQSWRTRGYGPRFLKMGRSVRYRTVDLQAWIAEVGSYGPTLSAVGLVEGPGDPVHIVTWCPWCESVHRHGAEGGDGHRVAHCLPDRESPLASVGYHLRIEGSAVTDKAIVPRMAWDGQRTLQGALSSIAGNVRKVVFDGLLGVRRSSGRVGYGQTDLVGCRLRYWSNNSWAIERPGNETDEFGSGLLTLACALYGVPPGVAAVRLLEMSCAEQLDADAAIAVQAAVEAWSARGCPSRFKG